MLKSGTWATEVEIIGAVHLFETDICFFDDCAECWNKYSAHQGNSKMNIEQESLHINHCYRAHYECVISVEGKNTNDIQ